MNTRETRLSDLSEAHRQASMVVSLEDIHDKLKTLNEALTSSQRDL